MSRMRMTFFVVVILALGAIVGALAASSTQPSLEELVKEVKALTGRVNQLEKQLKSVQSGAKPGDALEKEGRVAFGQINALISDGKIDEARTQLDSFMKKYGSTRVGKRLKTS